ncbi:MAG: hypothetical protein WBA93_25820 [Microcoleaceae cyanobacterium]
MTTQLTEQERYQLLSSLSDAIKAIEKELEATKNKLTTTADTINSYTVLWSESTKNYEKLDRDIKTSVEALKRQIADYKEETDRFKQYSKGIDENLEVRLKNFNDRFENFNDRFENFKRILEILEREVKSIREIDMDRINERIRELPSFEAIRQELSNSTSPLVTKTDFNSLENKVSKIEGSVNTHFRINLISMFLTLVIIILTNVGMYIAMHKTIISKLDSMSTKNTQQNSPTPRNPTMPSPSKPTP